MDAINFGGGDGNRIDGTGHGGLAGHLLHSSELLQFFQCPSSCSLAGALLARLFI